MLARAVTPAIGGWPLSACAQGAEREGRSGADTRRAAGAADCAVRVVCRTAALHCRTPSQEHGSVSLCHRKPSLNEVHGCANVGAREVCTTCCDPRNALPVGTAAAAAASAPSLLALCGAGGPARAADDAPGRRPREGRRTGAHPRPASIAPPLPCACCPRRAGTTWSRVTLSAGRSGTTELPFRFCSRVRGVRAGCGGASLSRVCCG